MKTLQTILSLVLLVAMVQGRWRDENILRFTVEEVVDKKPMSLSVEESSVAAEDAQLFRMLLSPHSKLGGSRLGEFKYNDCSDPKTRKITLSKLTLSPDPLSFPGPLYVTFAGSFLTTLDTPLSADVTLKKRIGSTFIKIPCLGDIGSCKYEDICDLLKGAVCPPPFVDNKVPCKCPFGKGEYSLSNAQFDVQAAVFPSGDYYAAANLTYAGANVGCLELWASFA